ncbi:MAG TPA: NAD(P)-binding domain-containing protein [Panacibacter sp.]|nr:NAD(P)-binding domain-containing protein [Panacibacter sp.]
MEKTNKPTVAVIGVGNIGKVVAANLVKGNRPVIVAARNVEHAKALSNELGHLVQSMELGAAINAADIIVMAVWFDSIKELFYQYGANLQGKIIVDPSNPIAPDGNGGFVKTIGAQESAGQILSALLPKDAKLVKALGTLGAASLANAAFQQPGNVLFYATDDTDINTTIEELITDSGFDPVRIGGINQSIRIEVFGALHEFGALGKTVTASEAKEKII